MSTERSIPHLRDVFGLGGYQTPYQHHAYPMPGQQQPHPRHVDPYAQTQPQPPPRMQAHHQIPPNQHHFSSPDYTTVPYQQQPPYPPTQYQPANNYNQPQQQHPNQPAPYPSDIHAKSATTTRKRRDNYKTLTSGDVKTLERHLSMKKTIRKKIMRDLQQAFVDDPNEFKVEHNNSDRLKSELNMEALRFGDNAGNASDNFLVMLRDDHQLHHHHPHHHRAAGGVAGAMMVGSDAANSDEFSKYRGGGGGVTASGGNSMAPAAREYDYDSAATASSKSREEKPSFWKRFTFKNKPKT